jgi:hypothetical protein
MANWKITIKNTVSSNALKVTAGMNVEITTSSNNLPLSTSDGKKMILDAFKRKYSVDLGTATVNSGTNLIVEKL